MNYFIDVTLFLVFIASALFIFFNWHSFIITLKIWKLNIKIYLKTIIISKIDILLLFLLIFNIGISYLSSKAHGDNCNSYQLKIVNKHEYIKVGNSGSWVHSGACNNPIHRRCMCVDESYFMNVDKQEKKIDKKSYN